MLRRVFLAGITGLAAAPAAWAQTFQYWYQGPGSFTVPLETAADHKLHLTVKLMDRDVTVLIDSGAQTIIDTTLARDLNLPLTEAETQQYYSLTGSAGKRVGTRINLVIGKAKISGMPADCMDLSGLNALNRSVGLPEFAALLGADLLSMLRAEIDYNKLTLTLHRPTA